VRRASNNVLRECSVRPVSRSAVCRLGRASMDSAVVRHAGETEVCAKITTHHWSQWQRPISFDHSKSTIRI
jgi:hypothetical protein